MASVPSVTIGNRIIDLHRFTGEVVDEKKWTTTEVAGSGGGYNVGSGRNNPVTITSSSVTHDQFFLKDDQGQERAIELAGASVAVRKGNRVTVIWGILRGETNGQYLAACNHATGALTYFDAGMQSLVGQLPPWWNAFAWLFSFFAICLYGIGIICLVVLAVMGSKRKNLGREYFAVLKGAVDKLLDEARNP